MAAAAVAEEEELVVMAEEARCGVAVALSGSQGVETHVSSAAMGHVTDHCQQDEVSAKTRGNIQNPTNSLVIFIKD